MPFLSISGNTHKGWWDALWKDYV